MTYPGGQADYGWGAASGSSPSVAVAVGEDLVTINVHRPGHLAAVELLVARPGRPRQPTYPVQLLYVAFSNPAECSPMKIYTRTGDSGTTGLYGGGRVAKCDPRIAAFGAVDELNAFLGVCRAAGASAEVDAVLERLQHEMFALGAELSSPGPAAPGSLFVDDADVLVAEQLIDRFESDLPALKSFVLPGGSPSSAALHMARTACRRAEREAVSLAGTTEVRPTVLKYLNRVSDLLFVLARKANADAGVSDVLWQKKS
jgi:cob(I)alamin adenosyltransferase